MALVEIKKKRRAGERLCIQRLSARNIGFLTYYVAMNRHRNKYNTGTTTAHEVYIQNKWPTAAMRKMD